MNKKNITPAPKKPIDRIPSGQLSRLLDELNEHSLNEGILPTMTADWPCYGGCYCFFDGDEE